MTLPAIVQASLARWGIRLAGKRLLLAVSGGRDSMALLHYAQTNLRSAADGAAEIFAVHVHHGVRAADADADAALVAQACAKLGVPFRLLRLDPATLAGEGGFEARAREARYNAMLALKRELACDYLCTAHHRDDQAETVLLRMLRGSTLLGLRAILPARADGVLRPFLDVPGRLVAYYATEVGVAWREDLSNEDVRFKRNLVRRRMLPALEADIPDLRERLARLAELALHATARPELDPQGFEVVSTPDVITGVEGKDWLAVDGDLVQAADLVLRHREPGDRFAPPVSLSQNRKLKKFLHESRIAEAARDTLVVVAMGTDVVWLPGIAASGRFRAREGTKNVLHLCLRRTSDQGPFRADERGER